MPAAAPVAPVAPVVSAMPLVQSFVLPEAQMQQVAQNVGLQWVGSDADKIAAVQAAIAAEPKPVHVPRERVAMVSEEAGPLVLVETKKDLAQIKLPFEQQG